MDADGYQCLKNLLEWAASGKKPSGGTLGDWVYRPMPTPHIPVEEIPKGPDYIMSLTPGAAQRGWHTPSEFPCTPQELGDNPLAAYAANLKVGTVFSSSQYAASLILDSGFSEDHHHSM